MTSRNRPLRILAAACILAVLSLACLAAGAAASEKWLCPICQKAIVDRPDAEAPLSCASCNITLLHDDLVLPTAYIAVRTRPATVIWHLFPECNTFREEGLAAYENNVRIWVPWSAVDYYIPRQRILRLTSGRELGTPYARDDMDCPSPPIIVASLADSMGDFLKGYSVRTTIKEEPLSSVYFVARSPAARDSARARFISEVEAGKHPRLPRTNPTVRFVATPSLPASVTVDSADVVLEVRVSELGGITKIVPIKRSGRPEIDQAALVAAYRSSIVVGGEMGIGVPSSAILTFRFRDGVGSGSGESAQPPMWREWFEAPQ